MSLLRPIGRLGRRGVDSVAALGRFGVFCGEVASGCVHGGVRWSRVTTEMRKIGVDSFLVLATMSVFVGSNLALQGYSAFSTMGAQDMVGMFVGLAGGREICPLLAGTMVAAKAGTELAAHLAVMRNKEQIDALEVMGVDPYAELVVPGFLAVLVVMPALCILSLAIANATAAAVAIGQLGVNPAQYWRMYYSYLAFYDFGVVLVKGLAFGVIIVLLSSYFGFNSSKGPIGVGQATNRAVVAMCICCILLNYFLSAFFYG